MVVGPGEADRYLAPVLERVLWWADELHVGLDADASYREAKVASQFGRTDKLSRRFLDHEGRFRQEAWDAMVKAFQPTEADMIVCIDADEVIHDGSLLHKAALRYPNYRLGFTFHHLWDDKHYRADRLWKPHVAWIMFPFREGASFRDRAVASGREPLYVDNLPRLDSPLTDILHYGYARDEDKEIKLNRYLEIDGGRFHNREHILSIAYPPTLVEWRKGGLLDV